MFRRSYAGLNKGSQSKKKLTSHLDFGLKNYYEDERQCKGLEYILYA